MARLGLVNIPFVDRFRAGIGHTGAYLIDGAVCRRNRRVCLINTCQLAPFGALFARKMRH